MGIYHIHPPWPAPFNFLNGTGMRIALNKRGEVGSRASRPVVIPTQKVGIGRNSCTTGSKGK